MADEGPNSYLETCNMLALVDQISRSAKYIEETKKEPRSIVMESIEEEIPIQTDSNIDNSIT